MCVNNKDIKLIKSYNGDESFQEYNITKKHTAGRPASLLTK